MCAINFNEMKLFRNKKNNGFSIGETILSVFILGVTMLTILSLYSQGLRDFQDERDSVIASVLAQEGVELARNIRDNNWAKRDGVTETTPVTFDLFDIDVSTDSTEDDCVVSHDTYQLVSEEIIYNTGIACDQSNFVLNVSGNFYTHGGGTATKFRRRLLLNYDSSEKKMILKSLVSWDNNNPPDNTSGCTVANKCVFSETTLTQWGTGT